MGSHLRSLINIDISVALPSVGELKQKTMKVRDLDVISIKQELVQWTCNQIRFGYTPESIVKRLPGVLTIILKERHIRFDAGEKVKFMKTLCSLILALHHLVNSN